MSPEMLIWAALCLPLIIAAGIAVMQAIKQALDPLHLLNPGKIF